MTLEPFTLPLPLTLSRVAWLSWVYATSAKSSSSGSATGRGSYASWSGRYMGDAGEVWGRCAARADSCCAPRSSEWRWKGAAAVAGLAVGSGFHASPG